MGLIKRLRALTWMINCEVRGMIPDTTAHDAADALEKLRGYAKHGPMCLTLGKHDCRCGLTDLLKDIGE